jgi:NAD(P)-dependent dehydrogenase (short-subunit alcohol dehydrogenase family)
MRGLKGKVAIVTGATKDMGEAVAERLAAEGAKVLCCGRDSVRGEQCAARIRENGAEARFARVDVSIEEDVRNAISTAVATFGRLDIVVGPFWFYKYAIPQMQKTGGGNFVNVSSITATKAFRGLCSYSTSKAALDGLSRQVAGDYSDISIRSNCVAVGAICVTESTLVHKHPVAGPALRQAQIISRSGTPDDVAAMVAFLASDESSFISGETLPVDGGALVKHFVPDLVAIYRDAKATANS